MVNAALAAAQSEVDAHLPRRYDLPISGSYALLKRLVCDVAMYRLAPDKVEYAQRYADAVRILRDVAAGKASVPSIVEATEDTTDGFGTSVPVQL